MGRMIDILRTADRRPPVPDPPTQPAPPEDVAEPVLAETIAMTEPPLEDDDEVPFIEVGGAREPALRLVPAPPVWREPRQDGSDRQAKTLPLAAAPSPTRGEGTARSQALLTIHFRPVRAAGFGGRGPAAELIAFHEPEHPISAQYRSLADEIGRQLPGTSPRVLLFAGAVDGVGTSTVLLNLAVTLARQGSSVLVIDAHAGRPVLAERLGLPPAPGLREILSGQMPAAWCVQDTVMANLSLLPAGLIGEPRDGSDVGQTVASLRERYDCILTDVGRWAEGGLTANLAGTGDAIYLVMRQDAATSAETSTLLEAVMRQTGRLRGCVLTSLDT